MPENLARRTRNAVVISAVASVLMLAMFWLDVRMIFVCLTSCMPPLVVFS
jgi:hypothetical protein